MRLVCTLNDQEKAIALSSYLTHEGIDNQIEVNTNNDWGSHDYGTTQCTVWVFDEDQLEEALNIVKEFQENPDDRRFQVLAIDAQTSAEEEPILREQKKQFSRTKTPPPQPIGPITLYIIFSCIMLYLFMALTSPVVKSVPKYLSYLPVLSSPVQKALMYDYPYKYELVDELINKYGLEALKEPDRLPEDGQLLVKKYMSTTYWRGFYEMVVQKMQKPGYEWNFQAPMFEKIGQGEFWRLFTPVLLHAGILHLFFNMIWLVILGKQMEQRMGKLRYIIFTLIAGIIPNTAQYLMSGPDFVGYSGILCAMLAYIWVRQKRAAWEGYQLQPGTISFIAFFILLMAGLQLVAFFFEIRGNESFPISIANTAHLAGALVGYLLGRMSFFSWQTKV